MQVESQLVVKRSFIWMKESKYRISPADLYDKKGNRRIKMTAKSLSLLFIIIGI